MAKWCVLIVMTSLERPVFRITPDIDRWRQMRPEMG
jgi:hypothetical protein